MNQHKNTIVGVVAGAVVGAHAACAGIEWRQLPPLPDAQGFASPLVGVTNGALLLAGGANFPGKPLWEGGAKKWHDTIFIMRDPEAGWQTAGKLPSPLAYGIALTIEAGVFCAGGSNETGHSDKVFVLKWKDGKIVREDLPALPHPLAMSAGAVVGNMIYIAGGLDSPGSPEASGVFWSLDLADPGAGWKSLPGWPGPGRFQAVAAAHDGAFYLFGGIGKNARAEGIVHLKDSFRYTPAEGWVKLADLPFPVSAAASPAPVAAGDIFLIGGVDGSGSGARPQDFVHVPQRIQCYSPSTNSWRPAGNAPAGRVCVTATEWMNAWILPSGEQSPGVRSPEVWSFRVRD